MPIDKIPDLHHKTNLYELDLTGTNVKDLEPLVRHEFLEILKLPKSAEFLPDMIDYWPRMLTLIVDGKTIVEKEPDDYHYDRFE